MKIAFLYSLFFLFLLHFSACSIKQHIVGTWKVDSDGALKNTEFVFQRNGTLELRKPDSDIKINSWEYSKKNKALTISKTNDAEARQYFIHYLDPFFLRMSDQEDGMVLTRQLKIKSFNHKAARRKLKGEWSLVQLEDSTKIDQNRLKFIFWDNGICQETLGGETRLGRWILSDDTKSITLSNDDYTQTLGINFTKKKRLQLVDNYGSYLLAKTERIPKSPSNTKIAKRIVGAWGLSKVGNEAVEDTDFTIYLNEDGSLKIFEKQQVSSLGQWFISDDGGFLVLHYSNQQQSYPIENISAKKLKLVDDFQTLTFTRSKS